MIDVAPAPDDTEFPIDIYRSRADRFGAELATYSQRVNFLSNLRLISGLSLTASLVWYVVRLERVALILALVAGVALAFLVLRHRQATRLRNEADIQQQINLEGIARQSRSWDELPISEHAGVSGIHPYAGDLDLFGHASLFHLLDTTATPMGSAELANWLGKLAESTESEARQHAVQELAPQLDWRQTLQMLGRLNQSDRRDPEPFLAWAESEPVLTQRRWLVWLARLGAVATVVVVLLAVFGVIPAAAVSIPLIFNLILSVECGRVIGERVTIARNQHPALRSYGELLAHLDSQEFASPLLLQLSDVLGTHTSPAHQEIRRLGRITSFAVPPSAITHFALQALGNWDTHVLDALERWQTDNGSHVRSWLETIGVFEALSALAGLSHDNPSWCFASIDPDATSFAATTLGHPLIPKATRVCNDVTVGPPGTFLLVTGSNMSGKSTLLRSTGVNIVLSRAGGPSCATSLTLPPVELWTSVRVTDSLESGISFYMAELLRLKAVYEAAKTASAEQRPFCYLLDEILQGTNSAERQIAARHIISGLVDLGAIGAVSTHDLQLAEHPAIERSMAPVHFTDIFTDGPDGPEMSFDYRLRAGIATSTNALRLMQIVGFDPAQTQSLT